MRLYGFSRAETVVIHSERKSHCSHAGLHGSQTGPLPPSGSSWPPADNEVQRTMIELSNQLEGFDPRGTEMSRFVHFCNLRDLRYGPSQTGPTASMLVFMAP